MNIGQVCVKLAGREAGSTAVVVDVIDDNFVLIDGNVRRKKCNIRHLEQLDKVAKIAKNATTQEVLAALKELNLPVRQESRFASKNPEAKEEKPKKASKKK
jgi:large subunit ribosomal protein L14e